MGVLPSQTRGRLLIERSVIEFLPTMVEFPANASRRLLWILRHLYWNEERPETLRGAWMLRWGIGGPGWRRAVELIDAFVSWLHPSSSLRHPTSWHRLYFSPVLLHLREPSIFLRFAPSAIAY
ncbi:Hypothetical protein NTJ_01489 [Nesidiocoris tenuis]|uniref:Uncharacterized protein n=3 Tax=Nesidiocoris tenuis TaxID=355587 RepID=A0ABN7ACW6_9HEMI|nr:Hypothetical protein NTJ_01489 [Nesidiocoris tenuis]